MYKVGIYTVFPQLPLKLIAAEACGEAERRTEVLRGDPGLDAPTLFFGIAAFFVQQQTECCQPRRAGTQQGRHGNRLRIFAALYHPAHLLGVETGTSVLAAALMKHATGGGNLRPLCDLCGRAVRDLPKGTVLDMGGHHHTIDGVEGVLNPAAAIGPDAALPFYLLSHRTLCRDVPAGKLITLGDLDMPEESTLLRLRREQDKAFGLVK